MDNEIKNTEQQPTTQPADNGTQGERLFTQSEVNEIIRNRLARSKTSEAKQAEPTEAELRERDLMARENRLSCREYLLEKSYPRELLDILDTSDPKEFNKRADKAFALMDAHASGNPHFSSPIRSTEPPGIENHSLTGFNATKHKPRPYLY